MPLMTAEDTAATRPWSARNGLAIRLRFGFEVVSALAVLTVGLWFAVAGWGEFTNVAAVATFLVVGVAGAMLVVPLTVAARHWAAAGAAFAAVLTPSGFAYLPNLLMAVVAIIEIRLAIVARAAGR
ncbi:MAG TPA: hypothetical protein DCY40_03110 [Actinobacteria bacterium]|nr:hypothetical protein [Actinomycetota bacterium]